MPFALPQRSLHAIGQVLTRLATVKPKEVKMTIGLDVGSTSVKAIVLGSRKGTAARPLLAHTIVPLVEEEETDASETIKTAMGMLQVPVRSVNIGVSGQWVIMRVVEMPALKPAEMKQALPFEAQRFLPFNIEDVVIDGEVLGPAEDNKMWVLIVACKKELIERRMDWAKRAGLSVSLIDVDALALANAFLDTRNGQGTAGTSAVINVGAQLTNLVILKQGVAYQVRDIPWGADKLSRKVAEQTGADVAVVSEQLTKGEAAPEFLNAVKVATEVLVTEVQLSFDYFENRFGQPPDEVLISGGLSQSRLFVEAFKSHVTQRVDAWSPMSELPGQFTIAYGLALRSA